MAPGSRSAQMQFASKATRATLLLIFAVSACGGGGSSGSDSQASASPPVSPAPGSPPVSPPPVSPPTSPPTQLSSWEIILQGTLPATPPSVAYFEMDGFETTAAYVASVEAKGTKSICYISAGTAEDFRSDFPQFQAIPNALGKSFPGFPGDIFLNINLYSQFLPIMDARIRMCQAKGFDFVDFDVIDSYAETASVTGFTLSEATQIAYITELTRRTTSYGMKSVQKNAGELAEKLQPVFGAAVFEECVRLNFCADAAPYIAAGKPVFNVEYPSEWPRGTGYDRARVCSTSSTTGVTTIASRLDLDRLASDRC